jgi:hypothetical protein
MGIFRTSGLMRASQFLLPLLMQASFVCSQAQVPDQASVLRGIDQAVQTRFDSVLSFNVTEHYVVYRGGDETHPAAEMIVRTAYNKDTGKSYTVLSEIGSNALRHFVLDALLENEKRINQPGNRELSWFTSKNYEMKLLPGGVQRIDGRDCLAVSISPRQKAPHLIQGTMWVDTADYATVKIEGTASKSASMLTGPAHVMRSYAEVKGFSEATHARAVSDSLLFGHTVVTIDYSDYDIKIRAIQ